MEDRIDDEQRLNGSRKNGIAPGNQNQQKAPLTYPLSMVEQLNLISRLYAE
jgi:hypothetical protein